MTYKSGIANLVSQDQWDLLYSLLDDGDQSPFYATEFYRSYLDIEDHEAQCFWIYEDEQNFLFYPFLLRSINSLGYSLDQQYYDVCGAYGYNGPVGKIQSTEIVQRFNAELLKYCTEHKVVTELVRYCPIIAGRDYHTYPTQLDVLDNVFIDLSKGLDWVWEESFEYRVRKTIRKGESYGLQSQIISADQVTTEQIDIFYAIYTSTMHRNEADGFYFFPKDFFIHLFAYMPRNILYVITTYQDTPVSVELVLIDGTNAFGFLGGTLSKYYSYKPNTFQRWELIRYLVDRGFQKYSMGGGAVRGDGIYSFKMSFAKDCQNPFYIGLFVHNPSIYEQIKEQWKQKYPNMQKYEAKLQCYRIQG